MLCSKGDELYDSFNLGNIGLEERAKGETTFEYKSFFYLRKK
jgi:hypothetical protein